jgi:hypothetical protein
MERRILELASDHPFVARMHCSFQNEHCLYFVLDFCEVGLLNTNGEEGQKERGRERERKRVSKQEEVKILLTLSKSFEMPPDPNPLAHSLFAHMIVHI